MIVKYKKKSIEIPVKKVSFLSTGLILRTKNTQNLFFEKVPEKHSALTSFFVFFPFVVLWLDKNKVVDSKIVKPFELSVNTEKKFSSIIEVPFNNKNKKILEFIVGGKDLNTS